MEHRDIQVALQLRFNIKALRAADILQVDAAKSRSDGLDSGNNFLAGGSIQADGKRIDTAELLKQNALAFHDRQTSFGADVAQAQHSSTVCDNCHGAALEGVFIHIVRVRLDLATGLRNAGGVGSGQGVTVLDFKQAVDRQLAGVFCMHFKCGGIVIHGSCSFVRIPVWILFLF